MSGQLGSPHSGKWAPAPVAHTLQLLMEVSPSSWRTTGETCMHALFVQVNLNGRCSTTWRGEARSKNTENNMTDRA
jgi:hypothetical protein